MTADLQQLRFISAADVYKNGVLAATLTRAADGSVTFAYRHDYLEGARVPTPMPVATTLPLDADPVVTTSGSVPPFFAGLLPEGHRLNLVRAAVKTSTSDELTLLLAVGHDTPGDVQVVPAGERPDDVPPVIGEQSPDELDFRRLIAAVDRHAIPGVQDKASASMISTPLATPSGRYILKLSPDAYPHLVENEHAHLLAARVLKVPVVESSLVTDATGVTGLLVRRFDRLRAPGNGRDLDDTAKWRRLTVEDATQVLGLYPASKYAVPAEQAVLQLAGACSAPQVAVRNLYLQFVFAWLTGNGDLHAKNVSVIRSADARWTVAPIYDVPNTLVYGDDSMALPLDGRTRGLKARNWAAFADAIGLPARAARSANAVALTAAASVDLERLPFTGSPLRRAKRELGFRQAELRT